MGARSGRGDHDGSGGGATAAHAMGDASARSGDLARIADALERIATFLEPRPAREVAREVPVSDLDLAAADTVARRFGLRFKRGAR